MRKGLFVAGLAVVILGAILLGTSFLTDTQSYTIPNPALGELKISPPMIGSGTVSLSWSGASSNFRFSIHQCTDSSCQSTDSSSLANGAGASGSVSFAASGGQSYVVEVPSGNANTNAVPVTLTVSGLTFLLLIGIVIAAVGAVVAFLGYRAKAKPKPVYADESAPQKDVFVTSSKPFTGMQEGPAAAATTATPQYRPEAPEASGPVYFKPEGEESYGSNAPAAPAAPSAGARPPVKCAYCGTMNEPWITNCRNCRRPLSSTGA